MMNDSILEFYKGKKVFVTGHTGFKGSWLCRILVDAGAIVTGYSLEPPTSPNLYELAGLEKKLTSVIGDIRDYNNLSKAFSNAQPEIVFHLAAQPIVLTGYQKPVVTYEINVMGTVYIMECVRQNECVKSVVNVTTDKVYQNREWIWGYRENEPLDGFDPYSNSKSCSELVTHSYCNSFFSDREIAVSTARAGNVIGGGDFANNRIIPDCIRSVSTGIPLVVRNPYSTRPYQHVLEPLFAYLLIAKEQYLEQKKAGWYNVGPDDCDCVTTGELVELFKTRWGHGFDWIDQSVLNAPHEANYLKLDSTKLKTTFGWVPRWHIDEAIREVCEWVKVWLNKGNILAEMKREISEYLKLNGTNNL